MGDFVNELQIDYIDKEKEIVGYSSVYGDEDVFYKNDEIRDVVTKEQFENMKYKEKETDKYV